MRAVEEQVLPVFPRAVKADPLGYLFLGLFLAMLGLVLLFFELDFLSAGEAIGAAFFSLGSVLLLDALARHRYPWTRHKVVPYAALGTISIAIGVAFSLGLQRWWPLVLVALGLICTAYGISKRSGNRLNRPGRPRAIK